MNTAATLEGREAPTHGIPAATVVIFRRNPASTAQQPLPAQLLMVERSATMVFAGGATVFPGGRIDPGDHELAREWAAGLDPDDGAARIAAVRETLEETGLVIGLETPISAAQAVAARARLLEGLSFGALLAETGWRLALDRLVPFARWWPRHANMRVFDTRFYLADLGTGAVDVSVDATENRHLFWASAREALELADAGKIKVIYPTRRNLERLALADSFDECRAQAEAVPPQIITPWIEERDGARWLHIPADAGYPVDCESLETADRA